MARWVPILLLALATACSRPKQLSAEDVRSGLRKSASLASESQLFVKQAREQRLTTPFAAGHAEYLQKEIKKSLAELSGEPEQPQFKPTLAECNRQLQSLAEQLRLMQSRAGDVRALAEGEQRLAAIAAALQDLEAAP